MSGGGTVKLSHTSATTAAQIPGSDIYVSLDMAQMERFFVGLTPVKVALASKRAAIRTREWLLTHMSRELATRKALPVKGIKARFRRGGKENDGQWYSHETQSAVLWIGFIDIEAQKAGTPKQTKAGVRVGKHFFDRAFHVAIFNPAKKVWRRKGKARFPVIKMTIPINDEMEEMLPRYQAAATRMFSDRLEHEINFLMGSK